MCLFQGSPERMNNNYIQSIYSYVPIDYPGGGGWTLMIETLSSLWEDWQHLKNIWTTSNSGLPLVRYQGVTLKFFQSAYTDYIVQIDNCLPMIDTKYKHADSAPNRMLLKRKTIRVPSLETKRKRKPFKKVFVPPPSQMMNKWYFQKDICDIPLVMITATSVDFRYPYCLSNCRSNNLTLVCLNPALFQRHDFDSPSVTHGYFPKPNLYLYSTNQRTLQLPKQKSGLIFLGNTKDNTKGENAGDTFAKWGNPFWHNYIDGTLPVWASQKHPTALTDPLKPNDFTPLSEPYFITVRYNPEKDTGATNKIYLVDNFAGTDWNEPRNKNLIMEGFPLYDMCWGCIDWWKKLHEAIDIDNHYIFVIVTDQFNERATAYIPVDKTFREGFGPYEAPITKYDQGHWNIKTMFQQKSINDICLSGPGCSRPPYSNYVQAKMSYNFHLKWGGCPKVLEKPYDPCSQPTWDIPSNYNASISIQNPNTEPSTELQQWDWRRDYIKQKAIERIKKHTDTDETLQIFTGTSHNVPILRQTPESTDTETQSEEETTTEEKIQQLKRQQRRLKHRILKRLKLQSIE